VHENRQNRPVGRQSAAIRRLVLDGKEKEKNDLFSAQVQVLYWHFDVKTFISESLVKAFSFVSNSV